VRGDDCDGRDRTRAARARSERRDDRASRPAFGESDCANARPERASERTNGLLCQKRDGLCAGEPLDHLT